jgi:hypothetical protein
MIILKISNFSCEILLKCCKIGNVKASGKQYNTSQEYRNEPEERVFFHTNGTLWWQRAQESTLELGGPNMGVLSVISFMDATFVKKIKYFCPLYSMYFISFHIFSYIFIFFHKWQKYIANIPPIQCRGREIDTENFNKIESIEDVMFGQAELLFTIKLKRRNGEVFEIPLF